LRNAARAVVALLRINLNCTARLKVARLIRLK
jgi:hypothetical protein